MSVHGQLKEDSLYIFGSQHQQILKYTIRPALEFQRKGEEGVSKPHQVCKGFRLWDGVAYQVGCAQAARQTAWCTAVLQCQGDSRQRALDYSSQRQKSRGRVLIGRQASYMILRCLIPGMRRCSMLCADAWQNHEEECTCMHVYIITTNAHSNLWAEVACDFWGMEHGYMHGQTHHVPYPT